MLNKMFATTKLLLMTLVVPLLVGCCGKSKKKSSSDTEEPFFKLSLGQLIDLDKVAESQMCYDELKEKNRFL